jgi:sec-independent protein translocase protein TatB
MFNIGPGELIAISMVALLVLGPQRLPGAVRTVGRVVGELRRISSGFQDELRNAFDQSELEQIKAKTAEVKTPEVADVVEAPDLPDVPDTPNGTEPDDDAPKGASDPATGAEPTEAAEQAGVEPGEDDEGASESQSEQDS